MATVSTVGVQANGSANLCTALTGNVVTTNVADRGGAGGRRESGSVVGPALLRIVTTVGATPTCTYLIEGSADNSNWFAAPYGTVAAPETPVVATFAITSATTTLVHLRPNHAWRYLRVTMSANTNTTSTIDLFTF